MDRTLLERELSFLHANLKHYLTYWPEGQEQWSPVPGKAYTLLDLASHLYTQPLGYAAILRGAPPEEIIKIAGGPWDATGPADLLADLERGMAALHAALASLSDEEFAGKAIPWPFGEPLSPAAHLMTLITHIHHHRGQFHLYLKLLGLPVDTGTVYTA
ncbi:MAG TPA: DinB family protein [Symbiobacteriaceae bacterium]|nr:DinB family protein [Symbiobacteriaceae bacterium]